MSPHRFLRRLTKAAAPFAAAAAMLALTSCIDFADWGDSDRYKEDFHYTYPLNPGGTLSLENTNGPVEIMGWEQGTVEINGTKYSSSKALLDELKVDVNATPTAVRIQTIRPHLFEHGNGGVRYSIRVPRRAVLDQIVSTNGGVRIEMIDGNARVHTTNGSIRVREVKGDVDARSTNGRVEADRVEGNAKFITTNGSIEAEASHGSFEANTTNGRIEARLTDPATNWPVRLHAANGRIDLTLKASVLPDVRAETANSSIALHLPSSANAHVRAHTSHNSISSEFDLPTHGYGFHRTSDIEGNIGSGGPLIELTTRNGSIKILKL